MVSKSPNRHREAETREHILDVAQTLLWDHGYKGMTMDDLARRAGLGKGTAYLYFSSKEDVALSVVDRKHARLHEELSQIAREDESVETRLRKLLFTRVIRRFEWVQGYQQGLDDMLDALRSELLARRTLVHQREADLIVELLVEGRTLGVFSFTGASTSAFALIDGTNSLLPYRLSCPQLGDRTAIEERANHLCEILVRGVSAR